MKSIALAALIGLTACSSVSSSEVGSETVSMAAVIDIDATRSALAASQTRSAEDKARDAGRKPAQVLAFLGLKPGDTALDILASGGWYSEVLSVAVGVEGVVYAQNNAIVLQLRDGANDKQMTARLAGDRLPNVVRLDEELDALTIPPGSVDVAITGLNFHDVYNGYGAEAATGFLAAIKASLKPGGVLGVIDHVGDAGGDNGALHRIDPALAIAAAEAAGFIVEADHEILANRDDDHKSIVFSDGLRGHTDRFVLRLRNPE